MTSLTFNQETAIALQSSGDDHPVDFDLAWVWLGYSTKASALRKLKNNFDKDVDYSTKWLSVAHSKGSTASRTQVIHLTIECFKSMGMIAGTAKGKEVRRYFLECEKVAQSKPTSMLDMFEQSLAIARLHEQRLSSIEEENRLLREKLALIESAQEANELETDANTQELERFRNGHGYYFSIAGWCAKNNIKASLHQMNNMGRKASAMCRIKQVTPQPVNDPRWGTVNTYPDSILMEVV